MSRALPPIEGYGLDPIPRTVADRAMMREIVVRVTASRCFFFL